MGKFLMNKSKTGYTFKLNAGNGETIGSGEVYSTETTCENGIASVKKNAPIANVEDTTIIEEVKNPKFEIYKDVNEQFRFRLKAPNGEKILASEGYTSKEACKNGISSVISNAPTAVIEKLY